MAVEQAVDPAVSRAKFDREIAAFRSLAAVYRARGIWLAETDFPTVVVGFVGTKLKPPPMAFAARLDFTNYDVHPPSVTIVHPVTGEAYALHELPTPFWRRVQPKFEVAGPDGRPTQVLGPMQMLQILQAHNPTHVPFLCLPGTREYHEHPAHTGDSWLLHRGRGEGTLAYIIEQLAKYGSEPLGGYAIKFQAEIVGFQPNPGVVPL